MSNPDRSAVTKKSAVEMIMLGEPPLDGRPPDEPEPEGRGLPAVPVMEIGFVPEDVLSESTS